MSETAQGPGVIDTETVGRTTIATTTMISSRLAMSYAAAIGDDNPAYHDDLRPDGLLVHPGISFSLQWNSRFQPDVAPNPRAAPFGVHAETDLRIHRPFRVGEAVTTQGRTLGRRQIAPGVYTMDRYRMTGSNGELIAELDYNGIIRGARLDGPDRVLEEAVPLPAIEPAEGEPLWERQLLVGPLAAQIYTECARIYNPIHTEPSVARAAGLPGIILHGSATKAMALSEIVNRCFDGDVRRVSRLYGQLRGMILMGTEIRIQCLQDLRLEDSRLIAFRVLNSAGEAAIDRGLVAGRA